MSTCTTGHTRTVGILIFDEVEVLDFCGAFKVFASTWQEGTTGEDERLFKVLTIAEEQRTIRCRGRLLVQPHCTTNDHPPINILVVPGGQGTRRERLNAQLLDWIHAQILGITKHHEAGDHDLRPRGFYFASDSSQPSVPFGEVLVLE